MKPRNIHGLWTIRFENRILYSQITGATNDEATQAWFAELQANVEASSEGYTTPWVILNDLTQWGTTTLDTWENANVIVDWFAEHKCVLSALVFSKKFQQFAMSSGLNDQSIIQYYFDYEQAHQACLKKLAEGKQ